MERMGLLEHLRKLSQEEVVSRWGSASVTEAYEGIFGPYSVTALFNCRLGHWSAYCYDTRSIGQAPAFYRDSQAPTKETSITMLEELLREGFQETRLRIDTELRLIEVFEDYFRSTKSKPALERVADSD